MEYERKNANKQNVQDVEEVLVRKRKTSQPQEPFGAQELPRKRIAPRKVETAASSEKLEEQPRKEEQEEREGEKQPDMEIHYDKSALVDYIKRAKSNDVELMDEAIVARFEEVLKVTIKSYIEQTILPIVKERTKKVAKERSRFKKIAKMCISKTSIESIPLATMDFEELKIELMSHNNYVKAYLHYFHNLLGDTKLAKNIAKEEEKILTKMDFEDVYSLKII